MLFFASPIRTIGSRRHCLDSSKFRSDLKGSEARFVLSTGDTHREGYVLGGRGPSGNDAGFDAVRESRMTRNRAAACDLLVLCGGLGTELQSVVSDRPKPMAMIEERPFVDFVIDHFVQPGIQRIILCTGYFWATMSMNGMRDDPVLTNCSCRTKNLPWEQPGH